MNEKIIPSPSSIHSSAEIDYGEILSPSNFNLNSTTNTKGLEVKSCQATKNISQRSRQKLSERNVEPCYGIRFPAE